MRISIVCFGLIAFATGCAAPALTTATFSSRGAAQRQEQQGLFLQIEAITDKAELKRLFGADEWAKGVATIHVLATNASGSQGFILQPECFRLGTNVAGSAPEGSKAGQVMGAVGNVVGSLPLALMGAWMQAKTAVVRHNMVRLGFRSATLHQGSATDGFLFFPISPGMANAALRLEATAREAGTSNTVYFQFTLNH